MISRSNAVVAFANVFRRQHMDFGMMIQFSGLVCCHLDIFIIGEYEEWITVFLTENTTSN